MLCIKKRSKHGYVYFASFAKAYKIFYTSLTIQRAKIIDNAKIWTVMITMTLRWLDINWYISTFSKKNFTE